MKTVIVGLGIQGKKRLLHSGHNVVATVDPFLQEATYKSIEQVSLDSYDCALVATPDNAKDTILKYLVRHRKHILVEKPLSLDSKRWFSEMQRNARANKVLIYTAYNHRFEPNFVKIKHFLESKVIGKIYTCRMFYGNGTARLVKESAWRDQSFGVLQDLGSHLLDTVDYWFGHSSLSQVIANVSNLENSAPDHVITSFKMRKILFNLEMSLCSWKNTFECDIIGSEGSLHIRGLCKWGTSEFMHRARKKPSGVPEEIFHIEPMGDPTWKLEYQFFTSQIASEAITNLAKDYWIASSLNDIYGYGQK